MTSIIYHISMDYLRREEERIRKGREVKQAKRQALMDVTREASRRDDGTAGGEASPRDYR